MRKRTQKIVKLTRIETFDTKRNKNLDFYIEVDNVEEFKKTQSYVHKVELAQQIVDPGSNEFLKNNFKNNPSSYKIELV